jgi:hypothetical protein
MLGKAVGLRSWIKKMLRKLHLSWVGSSLARYRG